MDTKHNQETPHAAWEQKAKSQDSAERREDYLVLALAAITVALVMSGVVGPTFFKSLFF